MHTEKESLIFRQKRLIEQEIIALLGDTVLIFVEILQLYIVSISARAAMKHTTHDQPSASEHARPQNSEPSSP